MCSVYKNLLIGYEFRFTTKMPPIDSIELFRYYYFYVCLFFFVPLPHRHCKCECVFSFRLFHTVWFVNQWQHASDPKRYSGANRKTFRNAGSKKRLIFKSIKTVSKWFAFRETRKSNHTTAFQSAISSLSLLWPVKHCVCVCVCARSRANMKLSELKQMRRSVAIFTPEMCNS